MYDANCVLNVKEKLRWLHDAAEHRTFYAKTILRCQEAGKSNDLITLFATESIEGYVTEIQRIEVAYLRRRKRFVNVKGRARFMLVEHGEQQE